jgi:hypothetical protein
MEREYRVRLNSQEKKKLVFRRVLAQCPKKLLNVQECDATDAQ